MQILAQIFEQSSFDFASDGFQSDGNGQYSDGRNDFWLIRLQDDSKIIRVTWSQNFDIDDTGLDEDSNNKCR